jgi:hypothetical protein
MFVPLGADLLGYTGNSRLSGVMEGGGGGGKVTDNLKPRLKQTQSK